MPKGSTAPPAQANHVVLEGRLAFSPEFRFTPAGRLVAHLQLEHVSQGGEGDPPPRIELQLPVLALGLLAEQCRPLAQGDALRVEGTLNQKRWIRDGKVRWGQTELLARQIGPPDSVEMPPPSPGGAHSDRQ
ncbi:MAG: single-stranded DNA-binding protein [Magnetococcales bacterium]|nr:single-stranded DNA-binding protein [Magnetococcales bacterium]